MHSHSSLGMLAPIFAWSHYLDYRAAPNAGIMSLHLKPRRLESDLPLNLALRAAGRSPSAWIRNPDGSFSELRISIPGAVHSSGPGHPSTQQDALNLVTQ